MQRKRLLGGIVVAIAAASALAFSHGYSSSQSAPANAAASTRNPQSLAQRRANPFQSVAAPVQAPDRTGTAPTVVASASGSVLPAASAQVGGGAVPASVPRIDVPQATEALFTDRPSNVNGQGLLLEPEPGKQVHAPDAAAVRAVLLRAGAGFFHVRPQVDDLQPVNSKVDDLGNVYYTYQQFYKGVPVQGKVLVVRTDSRDDVQLVTGRFQSQVNVNTTPQLGGPEAVMHGLYAQSVPPADHPVIHGKPQLQVFASGADSARLAYKATVEYYATDLSYHLDRVFVDAANGEVLDTYPQINGALNRQVYSAANHPCLNTSGSNINSVVPGDFRFGESGSASADAQESAAYDNAALTYWFYYREFQRDSYDNKGIRLRGTVHAQFASSSGGCNGMNAFYMAEPYDQVVFGNGDGSLGLSQAPDAVVHEYTHGVTHKTSDLAYKNESGALNEALSDIFGAGAEAWRDSGGTAAGNPAGGVQADAKTWIMCDVCAAGMQRYMNDPTRDGRSYDYYPQRYQGSSDNGGVHLNSGIINLAFYLLAEGGKHPRGKTSTVVTGIGMDKALRIYYDADTQLLRAATNPNTAFTDARGLLAEAAKTRYGACSTEWTAVEQSFDAVGIPGTWTPCGGGTTPTPTPTPTPQPQPQPSGNLAAGAAVSATSVYSPAFSVGNINDGDPATLWRSRTVTSTYQSESVTLDFHGVQTLGKVGIDWSGNDFPRTYYVQVRNNGTWQTRLRVSKSAAGASSLDLAGAQGDQLHIVMTNGVPYRWFAIKEITVLAGTPAQPPAPAPTPTPSPSPWPSPTPSPWPTPQPSPWPTPSPVPSPWPIPQPSPWPTPSPAPSPWPAPQPSPWPTPSPVPSPWPAPQPSPWPTPSPAPSPWPAPQPSPWPTPSPLPSPWPAPGPVNWPVPNPWPTTPVLGSPTGSGTTGHWPW